MIQVFQKKSKLGIGPHEDQQKKLYEHDKIGEPADYRRVWASEIDLNPYTVIGKLNAHPPKDFYGQQPVGQGDIVATAKGNFLVCEDMLMDIDLPIHEIKPHISVHYGEDVQYGNAVAVPEKLLHLADELRIPYGYVATDGLDNSSIRFEPMPDSAHSIPLLHPDYYSGAEASYFLDKLQAFAGMEYMEAILPDLVEEQPVRINDLDSAIGKCQQLACDMADEDLDAILDIMGALKSLPDGSTQAFATLLHKHDVTADELTAIKTPEIKTAIPLSRARFDEKIGKLLPDFNQFALDCWHDFAKDIPEIDGESTSGDIYGSMFEALEQVKDAFGEEIALSVFDFPADEENFCFNHFEMYGVARLMVDGAENNEIMEKVLNGECSIEPPAKAATQEMEMQ